MSLPSLPSLLAERCHYCSRQRNPHEILRFGKDGQIKMCCHCFEWHKKALRMFASGQPPSGCQECNLTYDELQQRDGNSRMYAHSKDGVYQVLCKWCSNAYERKRRDLYGPTEYGQLKKL